MAAAKQILAPITHYFILITNKACDFCNVPRQLERLDRPLKPSAGLATL